MRKVAIFKNNKLLWNAFQASTPLEKTIGLMFKRKAFSLLFEFDSEGVKRNAIHSFFCPVFDAVFLDSRKRVVCVFKRIKPWRLFVTPSKPAFFLIELPPGGSAKVRVGQRLSWNPGERKSS
ncbi:MAG: DUF192 domain-containing protein [Candidatus Norongarragalinales archaeon]